MTVSFERSHDILIDAPPGAVLDYVSNPKSWPAWIAASHHIESADRPLALGETFREKWHIRSGEVWLDWVVTRAEPDRLWEVEAMTGFIGKIIVRYTCARLGGRTKYTRTIINPSRPKLPTAEMIQRIDEEAGIALRNIKANVEERAAGSSVA